ncbi:hypothetical protein JW887_00320 [Candidatus Dojkabacteria bacterium]|nr:hypothetical protein [Candidatus Dojkabacteria bacterium]
MKKELSIIKKKCKSGDDEIQVRNNSGFSIVEVIVGISVFAMISLSLISAFIFGQDSIIYSGKRARATFLAQEGINAVKSISGKYWNVLDFDQTGLEANSNQWTFLGEGTTETIGDYQRIVSFQEVCRDTTDLIVDCPGDYVDLHMKKVTVSITWQERGIEQLVERSALISTWDSSEWKEDTVDDFSDGIFSDTVVSSYTGDGNGAVSLASTGFLPGWECIIPTYTSYDLPTNNDSFALEILSGIAYIGQEGLFRTVDVSNISAPVILDTIDVGDRINNIVVSNGYAYLASDANSSELIVVNVNNPSNLSIASMYDADSQVDGLDVIVSGNRAYLGTSINTSGGVSPEFYILDITNPNSVTLANPNSYFDMNGSWSAIALVGDYVLVGSDISSSELMVLDISDESNIILAGTLDLPGNQNVTDLSVKGNIAYASLLSGNLLSINVSDLNNISVIQTLSLSGASLNNVYVTGELAFIGSNDGTSQLFIIDVSNPYGMSIRNTFSAGSVVHYAHFFGSNVFLATGNNAGELMILSATTSSSWTCVNTVGTIDISGNLDAQKVYVRNFGGVDVAYIAASDNQMYLYNVTNPASPVLLDTFNPGATIYDFVISENYMYLATASNTKELIVVDVSDSSNISEVGSYDSAGNTDGSAVWINGINLFLGTKSSSSTELYVLNISDPASVLLVSGFEVGSDINSIDGDGNYLYLGTSNNSKELTILNVQNLLSISEVGSLDIASNNDTVDIDFDFGYVYLVNGNGNVMSIINVNNPSAPNLSSTYSAGGSTYGVFVAGDEVHLSTAVAARQHQIIDVSNKSIPVLLGEYSTEGNTSFGSYLYNGTVYIANANNAREIYMIQQKNVSSSGGSGYVLSGSYISSPFYTIDGVSYQILEWDEAIPVCSTPCTIQVQIRVADDVAGSPGTWSSWYGVTGVDTYFDLSSGNLLSVDLNNYPWVQYQVSFSGDGIETPVLSEMRISYY